MSVKGEKKKPIGSQLLLNVTLFLCRCVKWASARHAPMDTPAARASSVGWLVSSRKLSEAEHWAPTAPAPAPAATPVHPTDLTPPHRSAVTRDSRDWYAGTVGFMPPAARVSRARLACRMD